MEKEMSHMSTCRLYAFEENTMNFSKLMANMLEMLFVRRMSIYVPVKHIFLLSITTIFHRNVFW